LITRNQKGVIGHEMGHAVFDVLKVRNRVAAVAEARAVSGEA